MPARRVAPHRAVRHARGFVGRIVQDLDFEQLARIVEPADGVDQPIRDVHLVVDGQLDGDGRKDREGSGGHGLPILVLHVEVDQVIPVPPVHGENDEDEKVSREDQRFKGRHAAGNTHGVHRHQLYSAKGPACDQFRSAGFTGQGSAGRPRSIRGRGRDSLRRCAPRRSRTWASRASTPIASCGRVSRK
jgi:hypothetical protein